MSANYSVHKKHLHLIYLSLLLFIPFDVTVITVSRIEIHWFAYIFFTSAIALCGEQ